MHAWERPKTAPLSCTATTCLSCLNITEGPHTAPQQPGGQGPGQGQTPGQPPDGTNGGGQPTLPSGYSQIVFEDNYSKQQVGSLPDTSKWDFDLGTGYPGGAPNWGTGEVQTYTNDSANIGISSSGTLVITPMVNNGDWTSSRIQTNAAQDFKCAPGGKLRIEASVMLPDSDPSTQLGIWPAVWSMGSAFRTNVLSWPGIGELDILEVLNGEPKLYQTVHCGVSPGGPCNEKTGLGSNTAIKRGVFNKIAVEVDRSAGGDYTTEQLVWYLNDKATFTVTGKEVGNQAYWEALASEPKMILLNVAVGGEFPDGVQGSKTPTAATVGGPDSRMEIAYVAAYST
ncbi:concanavalin A-like lectin/glucanase [Colletotrichum eremochloae]|nr:concanavalin A-like lectin/glucanase [Colletotrichum eremochloae]